MQGADNGGGGAEDADGVAGGHFVGAGRIGEEAAEASRAFWQDRPDTAFDADASAVNPGNLVFHGDVVEEISRGDVVGAVDDEVDVGEGFDVCGVGVGNDGVDLDLVIDLLQTPGGGDGFGDLLGGVALVEEDLALEIGQLDEVAIDDSQETDAGAGEELGSDGAERAAADEEQARFCEAILALGADLGKKLLAVISGHDKSLCGRL